MAPDDRQAAMESARIAALARQHFDLEPRSTPGLPNAALAVAGDRAVSIVTDPTPAVVGGVQLWAQRESVELEAVIVDGESGPVRAWMECFDRAPAVYGLAGRRLVPAAVEPPEPVPGSPAVPAVFTRHDVGVIVEAGIVRAEVDGLEVARAVFDRDGTEHIEIGVGRYDRAGHSVMTAELPVDETLAAVVERVRAERRPGLPTNALGRLCRERWLRTHLVAEPSRLGLSELAPVDPSPARTSLLEVGPAAALGRDDEGDAVLVVASVGVDPGLAIAAGAVARREGCERIMVVMPPRDELVSIRRMLDALRWPVEMVGIEGPWR